MYMYVADRYVLTSAIPDPQASGANTFTPIADVTANAIATEQYIKYCRAQTAVVE